MRVRILLESRDSEDRPIAIQQYQILTASEEAAYDWYNKIVNFITEEVQK